LGKEEEAQRLALTIARMEAVVAGLPQGMKPPTLQ